MRLALRRVAPYLVFGALPALVLVLAAINYGGAHNLGTDFRYELYPESKLVLHGTNPFPPPGSDLSGGHNLIFPISAALLVAPLTPLPAQLAADVAIALLLLALWATLWVLDVRDWRLYGLVCLWAPAVAALQTGNLTLILGLLVALGWRYRERRYAPGLAVGAAVALKLFLWPMLVWLLATRRYPAAAAGAALAVVGGFVAVLPFTSLGDYLRTLDDLGKVFGPESYNLVGLLTKSHAASYRVAVFAAELAGLAVLALAWVRRSFALALVASLVLSPVVWTHYFALLVVPFAIRWPRLAAAWLIPTILVVCPGTGFHVRLWHVVLGLSVLAAAALLVEWRSRPESFAVSPGGAVPGATRETT